MCVFTFKGIKDEDVQELVGIINKRQADRLMDRDGAEMDRGAKRISKKNRQD